MVQIRVSRVARLTLLIIAPPPAFGGSLERTSQHCLYRRLLHPYASERAIVPSGCLHFLLCHLPRRGDLGVHQRGFSQQRACKRPESRKLHALDHERLNLRDISLVAAKSGGYPLLFFGLMVVCQFPGGILDLPRNQENYSRRDAAEVRD